MIRPVGGRRAVARRLRRLGDGATGMAVGGVVCGVFVLFFAFSAFCRVVGPLGIAGRSVTARYEDGAGAAVEVVFGVDERTPSSLVCGDRSGQNVEPKEFPAVRRCFGARFLGAYSEWRKRGRGR